MKTFVKVLIIIFTTLFLIAISVFIYFKFFNKHEPVVKTNVKYKTKHHSDAFNNHLDITLNEYFSMKDAFIENDTLKIKNHAASLIRMIDLIDTLELKKDTLPIFQTNLGYMNMIKSNTLDLLQQTDLTEMRYRFKDLSDNLRAFLIAVNYEGPKLYIQKCPMAFNDTEEATWISNTEQIMNPYLGKFHPRYQSGMLHCGEIVETIEQK